MTQQLWVPGPLPSLNDIIAAAKGAGGTGAAYSRMKREWTNTVALLAKATRPKLTLVERCHLRFIWREPHTRRDPDNLVAARKFVLDGLVMAGVLPDDGWRAIEGWTDSWVLDTRAGVEVAIFAAEGG